MKRILFFLLLCIPLCAAAQSGGEALTNTDIVKLSQLDLPSAAIISKIKNSKTHFDVGVDSLVSLKKNGVSGEVISVMIDASTKEEHEMESVKDYHDPKTMRKEGIYYFNKSDTNNLFIPIDPTVVSSSKSGGFGTALAQQYSYGIAKSKHTSEISGPHSHIQIPHTHPKFYFYCTGSLTPNEFALVKFIEKKKSRQMVIGSSNAYGGSVGIDDDQKVEFGYEQVAEGVYKVYAKAPFEDGEYCFIYTGSAPTMFSKNRVYDFGINAEETNH